MQMLNDQDCKRPLPWVPVQTSSECYWTYAKENFGFSGKRRGKLRTGELLAQTRHKDLCLENPVLSQA